MDKIDPILAREFKKFEQGLKRLETLTMKDSGQILWKYSSFFAAQLVRHTQPRKGSKAALEAGQNAVRGDIARVYASASTIWLDIKKQSEQLADTMYAQWKGGDINGLTETFRAVTGRYADTPVVGWDGGNAHRSNRGRGGRVKGRDLSRLVSYGDRANVHRYIKEVEGNVGFTKAGWIAGFNPPGGIRGVPKWVKERRKTQGMVVDKTKNGITRQIDFINNVPWIKQKFWWKAAELALNSTSRKIQRDIKKAVENNIKKV